MLDLSVWMRLERLGNTQADRRGGEYIVTVDGGDNNAIVVYARMYREYFFLNWCCLQRQTLR